MYQYYDHNYSGASECRSTRTVHLSYIPVVEILHEGKLRFERIDFFLAAVGDSDLFHCEKLPRALVETFEYLDDHKRRTRYNRGRRVTERAGGARNAGLGQRTPYSSNHVENLGARTLLPRVVLYVLYRAPRGGGGGGGQRVPATSSRNLQDRTLTTGIGQPEGRRHTLLNTRNCPFDLPIPCHVQ